MNAHSKYQLAEAQYGEAMRKLAKKEGHGLRWNALPKGRPDKFTEKVLNALSGKMTSKELADATGAHVETIRRIMRVAANEGLVNADKSAKPWAYTRVR